MIRLATTDDAAAILEIYRPAIENSAISFETDVPTVAEMAERIERTQQLHPWIVDVAGDRVRGYAYAGPYHPRAAYRWTALVSVFVSDEFTRQGIAGRLYRVLFALLERQGIRQVMALISMSNAASHRFHEAAGFRLLGELPDVGFKLDQWQSVGWWQRPVGPGGSTPPTELVPFAEIAADHGGDLTDIVHDDPSVN